MVNTSDMANPWEIKTTRAIELIACLEGEVTEYFSTSSPVTRTYVGDVPETFFVILESMSELPERWGAIVGDIVHNLRSALDAIMYAIITNRANQSNAQIKDWEIYFPVALSPQELRSPEFNFARWHQKLGTEELFAVLDELMPYPDREISDQNRQEILHEVRHRSTALLHNLSKEDKHRGINVLICAANLFWYPLPMGAQPSESVSSPNPLKVGQRIFHAKFTGLEPNTVPDFKCEFEVGLEIDVHPGSVHGVVQRLQRLSSHVKWCISSLESFASQ